MKTFCLIGIVVVNGVLASLAARGQSLAGTYFPLNDGDQKTFVYDKNQALTMTESDFGFGMYSIDETYAGKGVDLSIEDDGTNVFFSEIKSGYIFVEFNPSVALLDDDVLQDGGILRTVTKASQPGASYPATYTVKIANAGTITVPAGTFNNCRSITSTEVAKIPRGGTVTASGLTAYLAPGVGIIKTLVTPGHWAELVSATIGGTAIGLEGFTQLTVQTNGTGSITPNDNGALLQTGQTVTLTATTKDGSVFDGWTDGNGDTLGTEPKLTFTMQSNLVVEANFIPNPFAGAAGKYIGLFVPYESNTVQNSGFVSISVTTKGAFSGYLQAGTTRHTLAGQFDGNGNYTNHFNSPGQGAMAVGLNLSVPGGVYLNGIVTGENWTSQLGAVELESGRVSFSETGLYSVAFTDSDINTEGSAVMNFTKSGPTTLSGKLGDGTRFSASSTFSPMGDDAEWPFYTSLYGGKGCLIGWMYLGPDSVSGNFTWIQPAGGAADVIQFQASGQPK